MRVYPLASHNIDKAVLSGSKPQPSSRNTGRQTGGCMSIWGAYRQIKDAASIPIGRPWWTTRREKGNQTGREGMRMSTAKCSESKEFRTELEFGWRARRLNTDDSQIAQGSNFFFALRPWQQLSAQTIWVKNGNIQKQDRCAYSECMFWGNKTQKAVFQPKSQSAEE